MCWGSLFIEDVKHLRCSLVVLLLHLLSPLSICLGLIPDLLKLFLLLLGLLVDLLLGLLDAALELVQPFLMLLQSSDLPV